MSATVKPAADGALVVMPAVAARSGRGTGGEGGPITLCLVLDQALVDAFTRKREAS